MVKAHKMQKNSEPLISLIIPAFKQEKTIQKDLQRIKKVMDILNRPYEIIVVVDGMLDKTFQHAKKVKAKNIIVVGYRSNYGKGYAVRFGMQTARGDIVGLLDSGMDINPRGISMLLEHFLWYKADIIVGSKLHPASKVQYPLGRRVLSWGYRSLVRSLFGLKIRDTQAGLKFFKRPVLEKVLPRLIVKKYAFDIEILAVAHYLGYTRIYEGPIELDFTGMSSIATKGFWQTISSMLWDTCAVYYRLKILRYYDDKYNRRKKYDKDLGFAIKVLK